MAAFHFHRCLHMLVLMRRRMFIYGGYDDYVGHIYIYIERENCVCSSGYSIFNIKYSYLVCRFETA